MNPITPHQEAPKRAAVYLRVSTDEQVSGFGLSVQRDRCTAQATAKGWIVVDEYPDEGISGTKDASERPQLARLLADVKAGLIDAVIVLALDRLGRKTRLVLALVEELAAGGASLVSCKESLDTTTSAGQFVLTIFAGLAQLERDTIVERTTAGRNQRGQVDGEKGGRMPYGYVRGANGPQVDKRAAAIVRRIFALRRSGATLQAIADAMTEPSPRGKKWYPSGVREILQNERAYRGATRGASSATWPAILDTL